MNALKKTDNLIKVTREEGISSTLYRYSNYFIQQLRTYKVLLTPKQLYVPLSSIDIKRPIFLTGTQGAGLTLLSRMIRRHPKIVMIGGGSSFWTGLDEMDKHPVGHSHFPDALSLRAPGYRNMTNRDKEHPVFGLERSWVYATNDLLPTYRKTAEDANEQLCLLFKQKIKKSIRAYAAN
ncbi:MAG TPA: hypothetical protein EYP41_10405, partial [Anaerolineae bacterium]|nr:hypothetical protein [Anaerolineae bacterium]